jgi:hypothetical protein
VSLVRLIQLEKLKNLDETNVTFSLDIRVNVRSKRSGMQFDSIISVTCVNIAGDMGIQSLASVSIEREDNHMKIFQREE